LSYKQEETKYFAHPTPVSTVTYDTLSGSRDVIGHVTIWFPGGHFL